MLEYPPGATPIDEDEAAALIPGHITTQSELNEWEQTNIADAAIWARTASIDPFLPETVTDLHRRMFSDTWEWAGKFRSSDKNIGVPKESIAEELKKLLDDGRYWIENATFPPWEIALRLHHRMVWVHLFPNGNGRHARLWADLVSRHIDGPPIAWGGNLGGAGDVRDEYIAALRSADEGDYEPLLGLYRPQGAL